MESASSFFSNNSRVFSINLSIQLCNTSIFLKLSFNILGTHFKTVKFQSELQDDILKFKKDTEEIS